MKDCYLGVDIGSISTKGVIIDDNNKIIAKEYHHLSDFSRLMISSDAVNSGEIMDFCGEKIFQNIDSWVSGWLFFYDSCTLMNWEHACEYTLVIADNMILKQKHTKAPAEIIALEPI